MKTIYLEDEKRGYVRVLLAIEDTPVIIALRVYPITANAVLIGSWFYSEEFRKRGKRWRDY